MYRDVVQWVEVRRRVLKDGVSQRQVCRDTGIDSKPSGRYWLILFRSHMGREVNEIRSLDRMRPPSTVARTERDLPPSARLSIRAIYERIRDSEGFRGGYSTVTDFLRMAPRGDYSSWEWAYDVLMSLEKKGRLTSYSCCPARIAGHLVASSQAVLP